MATTVAITIAIVSVGARRGLAYDQCRGRIVALAANADDSLVVLAEPDQPCGCLYNRLIQPPTAANHRATYASAYTALVTGNEVSMSYAYDPATPTPDGGACVLFEISLYNQ